MATLIDVGSIPELNTDVDEYWELLAFFSKIDWSMYPEVYTEKHHLYPKSETPKEIPFTVRLPWKYHCVAHFLRMKSYEGVNEQLCHKNAYAVKCILWKNVRGMTKTEIEALFTPEMYEAIRESLKWGDDVKAKMSVSAKASWTEERRANAKNSGNYVRVITQEQKEMISAKRRGTFVAYKIENGLKQIKSGLNSDELMKLSNEGWLRGAGPRSKETRSKMSVSARKRVDEGRTYWSTKGRHYMNDGKRNFIVKEEDVEERLRSGLKMGRVVWWT
jgi:hypothetical protein